MYQSVTRDIEVTVTPQYLADRSSPESGEYFWAYTIEIINRGTETVQLRTRHWRITDAMGRRQEVRGAGVVGKQPVLKPGESFEYTSWTRIATPNGTMRGTFFCMTEDAHPFDAPIGEFGLTLASALH